MKLEKIKPLTSGSKLIRVIIGGSLVAMAQYSGVFGIVLFIVGLSVALNALFAPTKQPGVESVDEEAKG